MLLCGQSNRIWHMLAGRFPGSVGVLVGPSYLSKVPFGDDWMPFALDNDAFKAWENKKLWSLDSWRNMVRQVRMRGAKPIWAAVPDVVANKQETIKNWYRYAAEVQAAGWKTAFCVQDGMKPRDVPDQADVVFVGGTNAFKYPNLKTWTDNFPRVHCARVNKPEMFEACERLGCESIDGTGWFKDPSRQDKLPAVRRFVEGHRNGTPIMDAMAVDDNRKRC
jgi:hypothetical protein